MKKIQILSLDGGGTGVGVMARTLGAIYDHDTPGRDIIRQFQFVAGTSGGAIVMTALCCNYTPREIAGFYSQRDTLLRMFSPRWTYWVPLLRRVLPRYSSTGKHEALRSMFDRNQQPGEPAPSSIPLRNWPGLLNCNVNLIVPAVDFDTERATFFRSNIASVAKSSAPVVDATLVEAVHASTNAPILYFDRPAEVAGHRYWDGALAGYKNPVLAAVIEALANQPADADRIRVLSLGTGTSVRPRASEGAPPPLGLPNAPASLCVSLKKAASVLLEDPPDVATFHAHVALRQPVSSPDQLPVAGNVVRLCPLVRPLWDDVSRAWALPTRLSVEEFEALIDLQLDAMDDQSLALIKKACDLWMVDEIPNQPIRAGEHLRCNIGHEKFSAAVEHWKRITCDRDVA